MSLCIISKQFEFDEFFDELRALCDIQEEVNVKMKERRKKLKKWKHPVTVLMDDKMHISLRIKTKDMEISISDFVRKAIQDKIEKNNK